MIKQNCCRVWRETSFQNLFFLATALSHTFIFTLQRKQFHCIGAALTASSVLLPAEWEFRKELVQIQTTSTECIWNYTIQAKQLDCSLKSSDCHALIFVLATKERKRKKSCFFQSFVLSSLSIRVCLLDRDFAVIGFFDMYFYCFSSERRRCLKIKRIVH